MTDPICQIKEGLLNCPIRDLLELQMRAQWEAHAQVHRLNFSDDLRTVENRLTALEATNAQHRQDLNRYLTIWALIITTAETLLNLATRHFLR
jgi:hypothetical protein